mgnify:CR=1 FL=1
MNTEDKQAPSFWTTRVRVYLLLSILLSWIILVRTHGVLYEWKDPEHVFRQWADWADQSVLTPIELAARSLWQSVFGQ